MSARKAITRSKKSFRVKFPSLKNNCMVHCESMLEGDTARFLEVSHYVKEYRSQPRKETYYDNEGQQREYFPDFEVTLCDDSLVDIEVKPKSKLLKPDVKTKLEAVAVKYSEQGRRFRIVTEEDVQYEPFLTNLKKLNYYQRSVSDRDQLKKFESLLATSKFSTVKEAALIISGENIVYGLIAVGFLAADLNKPLDTKSAIWIRHSFKGGDNDPLRV